MWKDFFARTGLLYGIDLTFVSSNFIIAIDSELYVAEVVDVYEEAAIVLIPALNQDIPKSEHLQIFQLTVKEYHVQQVKLCNGWQ